MNWPRVFWVMTKWRHLSRPLQNKKKNLDQTTEGRKRSSWAEVTGTASLVGQDVSDGFFAQADKEAAQRFIFQQIFGVPDGHNQTGAFLWLLGWIWFKKKKKKTPLNGVGSVKMWSTLASFHKILSLKLSNLICFHSLAKETAVNSRTFLQQSPGTSRGSFRRGGCVTPVCRWTISSPAPSGLPLKPPRWSQHSGTPPSLVFKPRLTRLCQHAERMVAF